MINDSHPVLQPFVMMSLLQPVVMFVLQPVMATGSGLLGMASSMPASGSALGAALPRLREETELQKMLTDEKMRSEQHKNNYQMLKIEHTR